VKRGGLLIAVEGLDRAGTTPLVETLSRWLERKGLSVETFAAAPSETLRQVASSRTRPYVQPRVAALLAAADMERTTAADIRRAQARGATVVVDRYAWTAIARHVARGLDPAWTRSLYRFTPAPDLTIYVRQSPQDAMRLTAHAVASERALAATAGSFAAFLERVVDELENLAATLHDASTRPGGAETITIDGVHEEGVTAVRDAVKSLLSPDPRSTRRARGARPVNATAAESRASLVLSVGRPHREPGRLIVLEGIDGAGRSTQVRMLEAELRAEGRSVVSTAFGTSAIAGELLQRAKREQGWDPAAILLLYAADLAERLDRVILPALQAGVTVIADRYSYTPVARAVARDVEPEWAEMLFSFAPSPDAVVLLDLPVREALARIRTAADRASQARDVRGDVAGEGAIVAADAQKVRALGNRAANYRGYQSRVADWLTAAADSLAFTRVDALRPTQAVQVAIRRAVAPSIGPRALAL
jgi:dTMP kinase